MRASIETQPPATPAVGCLHLEGPLTPSQLRETTSIPVNPRTNRPVGYAFVDLKTSADAEKAIQDLSGKEILERKVSVQLARKPEPGGEKAEGGASGNEGGSGGEGRKRGSGRGRGRGRGRGGRLGRGGRAVSPLEYICPAYHSGVTNLTKSRGAKLPVILRLARPFP